LDRANKEKSHWKEQSDKEIFDLKAKLVMLTTQQEEATTRQPEQQQQQQQQSTPASNEPKVSPPVFSDSLFSGDASNGWDDEVDFESAPSAAIGTSPAKAATNNSEEIEREISDLKVRHKPNLLVDFERMGSLMDG